MTTALIIQARMGSTRFPGKMLAPLAGKPVIRHVIDRSLEVEGVDRVVVATTTAEIDDPLVSFIKFCYQDRVLIYRGLSKNALHRFYQAQRVVGNPDNIIRVTGDCPLVDPRLIGSCLENSREIYYGRTNSPDGTDVEVFSHTDLFQAYRLANGDEQEHVTTWIRKNSSCDSIESSPEFADIHYSVNTIEDLRLCERLIEECGEGARYQEHVAAIRRMRS